jgi:hypothetical protein
MERWYSMEARLENATKDFLAVKIGGLAPGGVDMN